MGVFHWAGGAAIVLSTITIIAQLAALPIVLQRTLTVHSIVSNRLSNFRVRASQIDDGISMVKSRVIEKRDTFLMCKPGRAGSPGKDGNDGPAGRDGPRGERGEDARDILAKQEQKCIICPQGKMGPTGPPGQQGPQGEKGDKGLPGSPAKDGVDGEIGPEGDIGPTGFPGRLGPVGYAGKNAAGGIGPPGPKGAPGPVGRTGSQGSRGKRNYVYGPPGPKGKNGPHGLDGISGSIGERGKKGEPGERGSNAKFCPCPLEMSMLHNKLPASTEASIEKSDLIAPLNIDAFPPASPPAPHETTTAASIESSTKTEGILESPLRAEMDDIDMKYLPMRFGQQETNNLRSESFLPKSSDFAPTDMESIDAEPESLDKVMDTRSSVDAPDLPIDHLAWRKQLATERLQVIQETPVKQEPTEAYDENITYNYDDEQEPTTTKTPRFKYVTKRPRTG